MTGLSALSAKFLESLDVLSVDRVVLLYKNTIKTKNFAFLSLSALWSDSYFLKRPIPKTMVCGREK